MAGSAGIVAGPGEKTFAERYHLQIKLPMPEASFLTLLKRLRLNYTVYGERGTTREISPPRLSKAVDLSKMQTLYQVYGGVDQVTHTGEMYWAYVDEKHRVVYIENAFAYTGP